MQSNIRVLVVDDSAFARLAISRELSSGDGISVIDYARDGAEAIEKIKLLKPDVVTLDVEMPKLDGLTTLKRIISECPTPVVMLSSSTGEGTETTIRALEIGAVDFFLKHSLSNPVGTNGDAIDLKNKIIIASKVKPTDQSQTNDPVLKSVKLNKLSRMSQKATKLVVIGSSTGGPKALYNVIPNLPQDIPAAILVVQHMPPGFTDSLARRLNQLSKVAVKEASPGDVLCNGIAYIAKGGYHLVIKNGGVLALNQDSLVCGVRPSVDVAMETAVQVFGSSVLGVVLTGMGSDGTHGAQLIKAHGGNVIVQDEFTCVVWGMPKSVIQAGYADRIIPLHQIAGGILEILKDKVEE